MNFIVNGKRFSLTKQGVIDALKGVTPERETKWVVDVEGVEFPVKQAFGLATDLRRSEFISTVAQTKLSSLGFHVFQSASSQPEDEADATIDERSDVDRLVDAVREIPIGVLGAEYGYRNLPLCLIDSVFSLGIRYTTTRRVVDHFINWWDATISEPSAISADLTVSDFAKALPLDPGAPETEARQIAKDVFGNLNRTSSRSGVLKSSAVMEAAEVCLSFGVDNLDDLLEHSGDEALRNAFLAIPGQGAGISYRYLLMLAGDVTEAKPDRMILRFISRQIGEKPNAAAAVALLGEVANRLRADGLDIDVRQLDHAIWRYESDSVKDCDLHERTPGRSKYSPLREYLCEQTADRVELTFAKIEAILGSKLPASALRHAAFWANHYGGTHVWAMQWMDAGWRVDSHSLPSETVVFVRSRRGRCE